MDEHTHLFDMDGELHPTPNTEYFTVDLYWFVGIVVVAEEWLADDLAKVFKGNTT